MTIYPTRLNPADGGLWRHVSAEMLATELLPSRLFEPNDWYVLVGDALTAGSLYLWLVRHSGGYYTSLAAVQPKRKLFVVYRYADLYSPKLGAALIALRAVNIFQDFSVSVGGHTHGRDQIWDTESLHISVADLTARTSEVCGTYRRYSRDDESFDTFCATLPYTLRDSPSYHATRRSKLKAIRRVGLLPSRTMGQGHGWTMWNLELQCAVYLTLDLDYAKGIAETLACRYGEPGVVLEVSPAAIHDWSKVVVDEDELRTEYGLVSPDDDFPHFFESLLSNRMSFGYADRISARYLNVVDRVECPVDEEE